MLKYKVILAESCAEFEAQLDDFSREDWELSCWQFDDGLYHAVLTRREDANEYKDA